MNWHQKQDLHTLIDNIALKRGEFTLSSGKKSNYYLDLRMVTCNRAGATLIGDAVREICQDSAAHAVGGLETGAIPIVMATILSRCGWGEHLDGFWVRKEQRQHGTAKRIEGNLKAGARVVIVEDVTTTGDSALSAVEAVREFGCKVVCVVSVVDRLQGAAEKFAARDIRFQSLFTVRDFGIQD